MTSTSGRTAAAAPTVVAHPDPAHRAAQGKAARKRTSLAEHAQVPASFDRDAVALLESQAATRVPELVPIRYGRMASSPFAFLRGAALVMAHDLAQTPASGLEAQLCGDAHLSNFGVYASPERRLVFDINDFDETHPGPFEWDLKRLVASFAVAGRQNGLTRKERRRCLVSAGRSYRKAIGRFAAETNLAVWYTSTDADELLRRIGKHLDSAYSARALGRLDQFRTRDSSQALAKLTENVGGRYRIRNEPPLLVPLEELVPTDRIVATYDRLRVMVRGYRATLESDRRHLLEEYELVQVARKVVGVGSVGTRAWILLFEGIDQGDPLFLQAKEAQPSVLADFVGGHTYKLQGERVVAGQRLMQATSDIFLGWNRGVGLDNRARDFYVRQLRDGKGSIVVEDLTPDAMRLYASVCGHTLARAHARSGDRVAIAAYLGQRETFDDALADFAEAYADQNERDHQALLAAISSGRVTAEVGV